jgi:hypothetical protein
VVEFRVDDALPVLQRTPAVLRTLLKDLPDEILFTLVAGAVFSLAKLHISADVTIRDDVLAAETDAIWDMIRK